MNTYIFYGEKPDKLNIERLTEEVHAILPKIEIEFIPSATWTRWPFNDKLKRPDYIKEEWEPANAEDSWSHPDILVFRKVPKNITRREVRNFILNHSATETDDEKERRVQADRLIDSILQNASPEKLAELKAELKKA